MNSPNYYERLEITLQQIGYSDEDIYDFKEKYREKLFREIGISLNNWLTEEQKKKIEDFTKDENFKQEQISDLLKKFGLEESAKEIYTKTNERIFNEVVEKLIAQASAGQLSMINKTLFND